MLGVGDFPSSPPEGPLLRCSAEHHRQTHRGHESFGSARTIHEIVVSKCETGAAELVLAV